MTEHQARATANVVMAAAAVGAAYYVLRTPPLRRAVWQMARRWAAGPAAVWLVSEVRRAWDASARDGSRDRDAVRPYTPARRAIAAADLSG